MGRKRKLELTAMSTSNRWRKKYKGKIYYFRGCGGKGDIEGYRAALEQWRQKKEEIDNGMLRRSAEWLVARLAEFEACQTGGLVPPLAAGLRITDTPTITHPPKPDATLGAGVDQFLSRKQSQVDLGELSAGRFDVIQRNLLDFRDFMAAEKPVEAITGRVLDDYHAAIIHKIKLGDYGNGYGRVRLMDAKRFIRWAYEVELLSDLPRNIDSRDLEIKLHHKPVITFEVVEVRKLLEAAQGTLECWLLLMLNCGMTQKDVSDLIPGEVNWKDGVITRKRSKTKEHANVPVVEYRLWGETLRLLKTYGSTKGERVLLSQAGTELKREWLAGGRVKKCDVINAAYRRLIPRLKITKPLKLLRKTSASLLAGHKYYGGLAPLFLGHSVKSIAEKHYTKAPQELLDEAIGWLGEQYGVNGG